MVPFMYSMRFQCLLAFSLSILLKSFAFIQSEVADTATTSVEASLEIANKTSHTGIPRLHKHLCQIPKARPTCTQHGGWNKWPEEWWCGTHRTQMQPIKTNAPYEYKGILQLWNTWSWIPQTKDPKPEPKCGTNQLNTNQHWKTQILCLDYSPTNSARQEWSKYHETNHTNSQHCTSNRIYPMHCRWDISPMCKSPIWTSFDPLDVPCLLRVWNPAIRVLFWSDFQKHSKTCCWHLIKSSLIMQFWW